MADLLAQSVTVTESANPRCNFKNFNHQGVIWTAASPFGNFREGWYEDVIAREISAHMQENMPDVILWATSHPGPTQSFVAFLNVLPEAVLKQVVSRLAIVFPHGNNIMDGNRSSKLAFLEAYLKFFEVWRLHFSPFEVPRFPMVRACLRRPPMVDEAGFWVLEDSTRWLVEFFDTMASLAPHVGNAFYELSTSLQSPPQRWYVLSNDGRIRNGRPCPTPPPSSCPNLEHIVEQVSTLIYCLKHNGGTCCSAFST